MIANASSLVKHVELYFDLCKKLEEKGTHIAIDLIKSVGGRFIDETTGQEIDDPVTYGIELGSIDEEALFLHPLLPSQVRRYPSLERPRLTVVNEVAGFWIECYTELYEAQIVEETAHGLLEIGKSLYHMLLPRYGHVDGHTDVTEETMLTSHIKELRLPFIMWANFFGPEYVQKYGKDFLLNAPGWLKEELPDGGVLYVVGPSLLDRWSVADKQEVEAYFRRGVPGFKKAYELKRPKMEFRFTVLKLKGNRAVIPVDLTFWDELSEDEKRAVQEGLRSTLASCLKRYQEVRVEFREEIPWEIERQLEHIRQSRLGRRLAWEVIRKRDTDLS